MAKFSKERLKKVLFLALMSNLAQAMDHTIKSESAAKKLKYDTPDKQLLLYSKKGDIDGVKECLSSGASINAHDHHDNTALSYAARKNRREVMLYLLEHDAGVNLANKKGKSPLHKALTHPNFGIVKDLLLWGADPQAETVSKKTPFDYCDYDNTVAYLVSSNSEELTSAIKKTYHLFLQWGIDPNNLKHILSPALHNAIDLNSLCLVNLFLSYGAHVNKPNANGDSPLKFALEKGADDQIIMSLVLHNAVAKPEWFWTSQDQWHTACATGDYKTVKGLLKTGKPSLQVNWETLAIAASRGEAAIFKRLIKPNKGGSALPQNYSQLSQDPDSLADLARRNGFEEFACSLVTDGHSDFINRKAFHHAVYEKNTEKLLKLLEDAKKNPAIAQLLEAKDANGNAPLHIAAHMPRAPNFELLYRNSANPFAENNSNRTPLQLLFNNYCPGDLTFVASDLLAPHVATILCKSLGDPILKPEENTIAVVGDLPELAMIIAGYVAGGHLHNHYNRGIDNAPITRSKNLLHDLYTLKVITSPRSI